MADGDACNEKDKCIGDGSCCGSISISLTQAGQDMAGSNPDVSSTLDLLMVTASSLKVCGSQKLLEESAAESSSDDSTNIS